MNERIKQVRNSLGLTQQKFADAIKVKRNTVATYEMGKSEPSDSAISLMCKEFNINEDWLRTGNGEMFVEQTRDEQISEFVGRIQHLEDDSFKKRMVSMLSKLNESDWEVLERMALEMSKEK